MKKLFLLIAVFCFSFAQIFAQEALIVKQEGEKVYMDISDFKEKPKVNDTFNITFWGSELKNPKTGKVLGKTIERRLNGIINVVEEFFAVGTVKDFKQGENLEGVNANIQVSVPAPKPLPIQQVTEQKKLQPIWQSKPLENKSIAFTTADIDGSGESKLVLAYENNEIKTYTLQDGKLLEGITLKFSPLNKIVSLDSSDLNGNGKAEIFVSYFDNTKNYFSTAVYEIENNNFAEKASIRGLVKGIAPYNKERVLYTQDIKNISGNLKFLTPALLVYKDGVYKVGAAVKAYKFHNIYGFNFGNFKDGAKPDIVYTQSSGRLRLQFEKKSAYLNSPDGYDFATTPTRIKFDNELLRFYASLGVYNDNEDKTIVAGIVNEAKLGILSNTFGSYHRGKLVLLRWNGSSLEYYNEAQLGGYAADLMQGSLGSYKNVLIVPFMTGAGQTTIALFQTK